MKTLQLPYKTNELEPLISKKCLESHYLDYRLYVNNLKMLITGTVFEKTDLTALIRFSHGSFQFNAIQAWNHAFYFNGMKPGGVKLRKGLLHTAISGCFGSEYFLNESFIKYASRGESSGWLWIIVNADGELEIMRDHGSRHPILRGYYPIFVCDLWEHSHIVDYGYNRTMYVESVLKLANWELIEARFISALKYLGKDSFAVNPYETLINI